MMMTSFPVTSFSALWPALQQKNKERTLRLSSIKEARGHKFFNHYNLFVGNKHCRVQQFLGGLLRLKRAELKLQRRPVPDVQLMQEKKKMLQK